MATPASVIVGDSPRVHAVGRELETLCGLQANGLLFKGSDAPVDCPHCLRDLNRRAP